MRKFHVPELARCPRSRKIVQQKLLREYFKISTFFMVNISISFGSRLLLYGSPGWKIQKMVKKSWLSVNILCTVQKWELSGKKLKVLTKQIIRIEDFVVQKPYAKSNWPLLP